jgi:hypothetical protein
MLEKLSPVRHFFYFLTICITNLIILFWESDLHETLVDWEFVVLNLGNGLL